MRPTEENHDPIMDKRDAMLIVSVCTILAFLGVAFVIWMMLEACECDWWLHAQKEVLWLPLKNN